MSDVPLPTATGIDEPMRFAAAVAAARLRAGHATELRVHGHSMLPYLRPGQTVLLEPCTGAMLQRGDLVAFLQADRVILHRVLAVDAGAITAKGDHVPVAEVVPAAQVIGRAIAIASPRYVSLRAARQLRAGRWIARLSALHAWCGRLSVVGVGLASGCAIAVRLSAVLLRPPM